MSNADKHYNYIINHPDDKEAVVLFFTNEAKNFVYIKNMIDCCKSMSEFEAILSTLIRMAQYIRDSKLPLLKKNYGFLDFKKREMVDRLIKILKVKEQTNKWGSQ